MSRSQRLTVGLLGIVLSVGLVAPGTQAVTSGGGRLLGIQPNTTYGDQVEYALDRLDGSTYPDALASVLDYDHQDSVTFSADGTELAYKDESNSHIYLRDMAGHQADLGPTVVLGHPVTNLRFAGATGQYIVAQEQGSATLTRYQVGRSPVDLSQHLAEADNKYPDYIAMDAHSAWGWFAVNGNVWSVDLDTGAVAQRTFSCHEDQNLPYDPNSDVNFIACSNGYVHTVMDVNPVDQRLLVTFNPAGASNDPTQWGWVPAGGGTPTAFHAVASNDEVFPSNNKDNFAVGLVSPDGSLVAWNRNFASTTTAPDTDRTVVVPSAGGSEQVVGNTYEHVAWQPCPSGTCPVFTQPRRPSAPHIGHASPGALGGRLTATARWTLGSNGGSPITQFTVRAAKLNSAGSIVSHTTVTKPASARSAKMTLPRGRYKFRVKATNAVGTSPWSGYSNIVRAR